MDLIRAATAYLDAFLPVSQYYLEYMPGYLGIPAAKMRLVPLGINLDGYAPRPPDRSGPFTVGYFARVAPEKGLHVLAEAYRRMATRPGAGESRLIVAGYLAPEHAGYLDRVRSDIRAWGLDRQFEYRGELDRAQKIAFLRSLDALSVPATYAEPKGIFLLEAMACGVPVVQPRHGAFPEIVENTGGGILVEPDNPQALADGLTRLWQDPACAAALGAAGARGVRERYTVTQMAEAAERVYQELASSRARR
jgi:glycosyltransferase involved in cell wall biosynthesis